MKAQKLLTHNIARRAGLICKKLGMSALYKENGTRIPVTLLRVPNNYVIANKTASKDGYNANVLAAFEQKKNRTSKPLQGVYELLSVPYQDEIREFVVREDFLLTPGAVLDVSHFAEGMVVDVRAVSIGKGTAGSMKRWGFGGQGASHGVSVTHRSHGSTGACQDPGRVFKGKKMAGHMGSRFVTIQNLEIVHIDLEHGLMAVRGAVPGAEGTVVCVSDAVKHVLDVERVRALVHEKGSVSKESGLHETSNAEEAA